MDACKCIVPLQHGGTLSSYRATSFPVRLVEGKERWEAPQGVLPLNCVGIELNSTVTCIVLKGTANRCTSRRPTYLRHNFSSFP
ncbi:hypothetical protein TNCV_4116851 [Trichonephila clavipes]|nr:hypothetical protein TNCV_4116851 [Trichonephila clavipes]